MATPKNKHLLLIQLGQSPLHPELPRLEWACVHANERIPTLKASPIILISNGELRLYAQAGSSGNAPELEKQDQWLKLALPAVGNVVAIVNVDYHPKAGDVPEGSLAYDLNFATLNGGRGERYKIRSTSKYQNVFLCEGCKRRSDNSKERNGSDKYLFVPYVKSGPGGPPKPIPPASFRAKAGE
jgi:hypothetical protein